jgi:hypothetical protein
MDRGELIDISNRYLDALMTRDPGDIPLAEEATRTDHGKLVADGADKIRAYIERDPTCAITSRRHLVDGDDVVVVYDLDVELDAERADGGEAQQVFVYLMERFHIVDGMITEIEPVYATDASRRPRPDRPSRYPATTPSRAEVVDTATKYLDALVSHVGSKVPLAPEAWRIENGHNSGDSGPAIAAALEIDIMKVVAGITETRWYVEGDTGIAYYTLHVDASLMPGAAADETGQRRVAMAERFRVHEGEVCEIEAVIGAEM